jgi:hypothetical protein
MCNPQGRPIDLVLIDKQIGTRGLTKRGKV